MNKPTEIIYNYIRNNPVLMEDVNQMKGAISRSQLAELMQNYFEDNSLRRTYYYCDIDLIAYTLTQVNWSIIVDRLIDGDQNLILSHC